MSQYKYQRIVIFKGAKAMPQMKRINGASFDARPPEDEKMTEEEYEDRLDFCAAAEAVDEALATGEIRSFEDFAKEMGI
jgi:hypothetical protein